MGFFLFHDDFEVGVYDFDTVRFDKNVADVCRIFGIFDDFIRNGNCDDNN